MSLDAADHRKKGVNEPASLAVDCYRSHAAEVGVRRQQIFVACLAPPVAQIAKATRRRAKLWNRIESLDLHALASTM
jgi:hypothetical protein